MDTTIISQRYAKALFDLAIEMKILEQVNKDMDVVCAVTIQNPEFKRLLKSPIIPPGKKNDIISAIFKKNLDVLTFKFLQLLVRKEREVFLQDICLAFTKLYKKYKNILTIKLSSSQPLDEQSKKELVKVLVEATHKKIELIEETDKDLLGGFVLTMDDKKYDASVKHQLARLRKSFDKNLYVREF